jgi:chromosome segregation ATPase
MAVGVREPASALIGWLVLGLVGGCSQVIDVERELAQCRQELRDKDAAVESILADIEELRAERASLRAEAERIGKQLESLQLEAERARLLVEKEMLERKIAENEAAQVKSQADSDAKSDDP